MPSGRRSAASHGSCPQFPLCKLGFAAGLLGGKADTAQRAVAAVLWFSPDFIPVCSLRHRTVRRCRLCCPDSALPRALLPSGGASSRLLYGVAPVKVSTHLWAAAHLPKGQNERGAGSGCLLRWPWLALSLGTGGGVRRCCSPSRGASCAFPYGPILGAQRMHGSWPAGCQESASAGETPGVAGSPRVSSRPPCRCAQMPSSPEGPWATQRHQTLGTCVPQRAGSVDGSEHGSGAGLRGGHQAGVLRVGAQREAGPALGSSPCSLLALRSGPLPGPAGTAQSAPFLRAKSLAASSVQGHFSRTHSRAVLLSQCPAWT